MATAIPANETGAVVLQAKGVTMVVSKLQKPNQTLYAEEAAAAAATGDTAAAAAAGLRSQLSWYSAEADGRSIPATVFYPPGASTQDITSALIAMQNDPDWATTGQARLERRPCDRSDRPRPGCGSTSSSSPQCVREPGASRARTAVLSHFAPCVAGVGRPCVRGASRAS